MLILLQSFRIIELEWACSSAGRAPALQLSRLNYISAASGVAYTQTYGAIIALSWTEVDAGNIRMVLPPESFLRGTINLTPRASRSSSGRRVPFQASVSR